MLSRTLLTAAILVSLSATSSLADPPARVGRISYVGGTVSYHGADDADWSAATLNYPVTNGAALWTEPSARAEIQVGDAKVRIDSGTEVDVVRLDDTATELDVPQGDVNINVHTMPQGGFNVSTPRGAISITRPGVYHIGSGHSQGDVPDPVQVTVLSGEAQLQGQSQAVTIPAGDNATIGGNPQTYTLQQAQLTDLDQWAQSRDRQQVAPQTVRYVSPDTTGYQDLDTYGQWDSDPQYGAVWYPQTVVADWEPYRYGHWAYVAPWGWTWVDDAAWGFTPFHYGRWARIHDRWAWCPGERAPRPVYAPALVAFIGNGIDIDISAGHRGQGIGWVPLAPHEVFHPYYPASVTYARNVNRHYVNRSVVNKITVNNYRNVTVNKFANRGAATVVSSDNFARSQSVHRSMLNVPANRLETARVENNLAQVKPTAEARHNGLPAAQQAPRPERVNFDRQHGNFNRVAPANQHVAAPQVTRPETPQMLEAHTPQVTRPNAPNVITTQQVQRPQAQRPVYVNRSHREEVRTPEVQSQTQFQAPTITRPQVQQAQPQNRVETTTRGWVHGDNQPNNEHHQSSRRESAPAVQQQRVEQPRAERSAPEPRAERSAPEPRAERSAPQPANNQGNGDNNNNGGGGGGHDKHGH